MEGGHHVQVFGQPEYVDDLAHGGGQPAQLHAATSSKDSASVQDWRQPRRVGEAHPSAINSYEPVDRRTAGAMQKWSRTACSSRDVAASR